MLDNFFKNISQAVDVNAAKQEVSQEVSGVREVDPALPKLKNEELVTPPKGSLPSFNLDKEPLTVKVPEKPLPRFASDDVGEPLTVRKAEDNVPTAKVEADLSEGEKLDLEDYDQMMVKLMVAMQRTQLEMQKSASPEKKDELNQRYEWMQDVRVSLIDRWSKTLQSVLKDGLNEKDILIEVPESWRSLEKEIDQLPAFSFKEIDQLPAFNLDDKPVLKQDKAETGSQA
ncbi:MAG: hypothetical protein WC750_05060 [Patescibacteria group bacterium]|jgi:hypothetical protein